MFKGVFTAIVTPFNKGKVDLDSLSDLIDFNLDNGIDGIIACGTTGEAPTLSDEEYSEVIRFAVKRAKGRGAVIAGAGANSTDKSIKNAKYVKEAGADAALVVTPYYNKPTQKGLLEHFRAVAKEADIPVILYNVPARTGVNLLPDTVVELSSTRNICGIKEASGSLIQISDIRRRCPDDFSVLSGDDQLFLPTLAVGGDGIISVASNVIPKEIKMIHEHFVKRENLKAQELFLKIFPVLSALFIETNPIPVKAALSLMGKIKNELRLPLSRIGEENLLKLKASLKELGII